MLFLDPEDEAPLPIDIVIALMPATQRGIFRAREFRKRMVIQTIDSEAEPVHHAQQRSRGDEGQQLVHGCTDQRILVIARRAGKFAEVVSCQCGVINKGGLIWGPSPSPRCLTVSLS
jgi:hypothetical protein